MHEQTVVGLERIIRGMGEKRWGTVLPHSDIRRKLVLVLRDQIRWVDQHGEVWPAIDLVDVVDWFVGASIKVGGRGSRTAASSSMMMLSRRLCAEGVMRSSRIRTCGWKRRNLNAIDCSRW